MLSPFHKHEFEYEFLFKISPDVPFQKFNLYVTDGWTDSDRQTDIPSYRDARTHLKMTEIVIFDILDTRSIR